MRGRAILVGAMLASSASAQDKPIDFQLFRPAVDSKGYFTQNASQILGHLEPSFGLMTNYGLRPLELQGDHGNRLRVDNLITVHLQAALGLFGRAEVGLGVPLSIWSGKLEPDSGPFDGQGAGDLVLHGKGRILSTSRDPVGLGVVVSASAPTGNDSEFLGEGQWVLAPSLIVDEDYAADRVHVALNAGARLRPERREFHDETFHTPGLQSECPDLAGGPPCGTDRRVVLPPAQATWGVGFAYGIVPQRFDFVAEIFGSYAPRGDSDVALTPLEAVGGFKFYLARNSYLAFGGGSGITEALGSPDLRVFGSVIFEPSVGDFDGDTYKDDVDLCPKVAEDFDDFEDGNGCPEPDNDRDGLVDARDACPNEPEDKDGRQDEDGCWEPDELDRDGDAIVDEQDKCPDEPEDRDGFEDGEGCPEPDNDQDQIVDVDDSCPNDPEDHDRFQDEEGCPDPDNDKDRIVDLLDKCPNEPEVYNGLEDEDGCPDKGRVLVRKGRIEILDKIFFETNKAIIKPMSFPLLDAIAATLKGNPQILQVEIQGHADERAEDQHNIELTQARAESVREHVVGKGIDPKRLTATGYGETKPVCGEHNEDCWSKNRRVEFVILRRAEESD
ncbi:MAG: OmpA family protein [Myxococcota bacterium]